MPWHCQAWRVNDATRRLIYNLLRSPPALWEALKVCYNEDKPELAGQTFEIGWPPLHHIQNTLCARVDKTNSAKLFFFVWDESIFYPNNAGTYPKIRSSWVSTIGGAVEFDGFLNIFLIDAYCGPASFDHGQPRWWLFRGWCTAPWASPEPMERDPGMEPLVQIKLA